MKDQNPTNNLNFKSLLQPNKSLTMKNFLITLSFLLTTGILSAQVKIGLRLNSPSVSAKEASKEYFVREVGSVFNVNYLSTKTSYAYGLGFYKDIGSAYIGADILYRKKTVQYKIDEIKVSTRSAEVYVDKFQEITVPVVAGWRKNNFKLGLGPVFTVKADREFTLNSMPGFTVDERKIDTGFQFQLGYIVRDRIHIDLKHESSFNQSGDDYKVLGKQMNLKNLPNALSLGVGIFF